MSKDIKVEAISRDKKGVTFRLPDGTERYIAGDKIEMVYCKERNIDDAINKVADPEVTIDFLLADTGFVLCFGMANRI